MGDHRGRLILVSYPDEAKEFLIALLKRISPRASEEKINNVISSLPATLVRNTTASSANKVIALAKSKGVVITFEPAEQGEQTQSSEEQVAAATPAPDPKKKAPEVPQEKEKPGAASPARSKGMALLLLLIMGAGLYFYSDTPPIRDAINTLGGALGLIDPAAVAKADRMAKNQKRRTPNKHGAISLNQYVLDPDSDHLAAFDRTHAPPLDWRFIRGLELAATMAVERAPAFKGAKVSTSVSQRSVSEFAVTISVASPDGKKQQATKLLSNDPEKIEAVVDGLAEFLRSFVGVLGGEVKERPLDTYTPFWPGAAPHDYVTLNKSLIAAGDRLAVDALQPAAWLAISEGYGWNALFRSSNDYRKPAHLAASRGLAAYLTAALSLRPDDRWLATIKGLTLLGLGYPAASVTPLKTGAMGDKGLAELLIAYTTADNETLKTFAGEPGPYQSVAYLLLAKALHRLNRSDEARAHYPTIVKEFPAFLYGMEAAIANGDLGLRRSLMAMYPFILARGQQEILTEVADTAPMAGDNDFAVATAVDPPPEKIYEMFEAWLLIGRTFHEKLSVQKKGGPAISIPSLSELFTAELKGALAHWYAFSGDMLASSSGAAWLVDLAQKAYPDSEFSHAIKLRYLNYFGDTSQVKKHLKQVVKKANTPFLVRAILDSYDRFWEDFHRYTTILPLLEKLRTREPPDAFGSILIGREYKAQYYSLIAERYSRRALSVDPYNNWILAYHSYFVANGDFLEEGRQRLGETFGYHMVAADWHALRKNFVEAADHFGSAIKLSPDDWSVYKQFSDMLYDEGKNEEALAVCLSFPGVHTPDLRGAHIAYRAARSLNDLGRPQEAFDLLEPLLVVGQGGVLAEYARAAELLGKRELALEYFMVAAERYSSSPAPVDLALYYLRNGDEPTAVKILRDHADRQGERYYAEQVIDHFVERNQIKDALPFIEKVEEGRRREPFWDYYLAEIFVEKKQFQVAAGILEKRIDRSPHANSYAAKFFETVMAGELMPPQAAMDRVLKVFNASPRHFEYFGISLFSLGFYNEAYLFFEKKYHKEERRKGIALLMMAYANRAAGARPERTDAIRKFATATDLLPFHPAVIAYLIGDSPYEDLQKGITTRGDALETHIAAALYAIEKGDTALAYRHALVGLDTTEPNYIEYLFADTIAVRYGKRN